MTFKLGLAEGKDALDTEYVQPATFAREPTNDGQTRIVAGAPHGDPIVFRSLVQDMEPPFYLLYILHTPRGEGEPGRYQSPLLTAEQLSELLDHYDGLLRGDGRHHIWVHSPQQGATVAWDNHNLVHGYGPLERFDATLRAIGHQPGERILMDQPHVHHYRDEYDEQALALLGELDWHWSELRDGD